MARTRTTRSATVTGVTWIGAGGPATVGEFAYDALGRMITAYTRFDSLLP
jgi:hypothetical protein